MRFAVIDQDTGEILHTGNANINSFDMRRIDAHNNNRAVIWVQDAEPVTSRRHYYDPATILLDQTVQGRTVDTATLKLRAKSTVTADKEQIDVYTTGVPAAQKVTFSGLDGGDSDKWCEFRIEGFVSRYTEQFLETDTTAVLTYNYAEPFRVTVENFPELPAVFDIKVV